jgi:hypothetical protein
MEKIDETNSTSVDQSLAETLSIMAYEETEHEDSLIFEESNPYKLFIADIIY